jgi:hypothetical protein
MIEAVDSYNFASQKSFSEIDVGRKGRGQRAEGRG